MGHGRDQASGSVGHPPDADPPHAATPASMSRPAIEPRFRRACRTRRAYCPRSRSASARSFGSRAAPSDSARSRAARPVAASPRASAIAPAWNVRRASDAPSAAARSISRDASPYRPSRYRVQATASCPVVSGRAASDARALAEYRVGRSRRVEHRSGAAPGRRPCSRPRRAARRNGRSRTGVAAPSASPGGQEVAEEGQRLGLRSDAAARRARRRRGRRPLEGVDPGKADDRAEVGRRGPREPLRRQPGAGRVPGQPGVLPDRVRVEAEIRVSSSASDAARARGRCQPKRPFGVAGQECESGRCGCRWLGRSWPRSKSRGPLARRRSGRVRARRRSDVASAPSCVGRPRYSPRPRRTRRRNRGACRGSRPQRPRRRVGRRARSAPFGRGQRLLLVTEVGRQPAAARGTGAPGS